MMKIKSLDFQNKIIFDQHNFLVFFMIEDEVMKVVHKVVLLVYHFLALKKVCL